MDIEPSNTNINENDQVNVIPEIEVHTFENNNILSFKIIGKSSMLVALYPNSRIYFLGNFKLKSVLGIIFINGYKFSKDEEQVIFSGKHYVSYCLEAKNGLPIKSYSEAELKEFNIPIEWTQSFNIAQNEPVVIVKLSRFSNNVIKYVEQQERRSNTTLDLWSSTLGIELIQPEYTNIKLYRESNEWNLYFQDKLLPDINKGLRIFLTGGKSVGKSTLLRYLINRLLSEDTKEILLVDLDPGQSEVGPATTLSISIVSQPLLGPPFTHKVSQSYHVLLGTNNVNNMVCEYVCLVRKLAALLDGSEDTCFTARGRPVIVNTMGYLKAEGFDVLIDSIRYLRPTHVLTLQSQDEFNNFQKPLSQYSVATVRRGVFSTPGPISQCHFDVVQSVAGNTKNNRNSSFFRDLLLMSELSKLWPENSCKFVPNKTISVSLSWNSIAFHVIGSYVPMTHILQAMNASLVALLNVHNTEMESIGPNIPLRFQDGGGWLSKHRFVCWAVVKGIDPTLGEIHLLTTGPHEDVKMQVNAIVLTQMHLPPRFKQRFRMGDEPGPYRE